jgi:hypothetical protein
MDEQDDSDKKEKKQVEKVLSKILEKTIRLENELLTIIVP